jgi:cytoskeletal protein CcmA (bactofilin family)
MGSAKVELKTSAKVEGDISSPKFVMEDGAALAGKVDTGPRK